MDGRIAEAGNSPGPGPEVLERRRVRSRTAQNEMRGVLGEMTADDARRNVDSREKI